VWNGERVLPEGWVKYSTSPVPADPEQRYGAHFWLQIPEEYRGTNRELPAGTYHAAGHEAQFVTVVPSRKVVIVGGSGTPDTRRRGISLPLCEMCSQRLTRIGDEGESSTGSSYANGADAPQWRAYHLRR
jgi:CubicO group peptidase (beta-lactamase class C family)